MSSMANWNVFWWIIPHIHIAEKSAQSIIETPIFVNLCMLPKGQIPKPAPNLVATLPNLDDNGLCHSALVGEKEKPLSL